jgi:hypothetical protein
VETSKLAIYAPDSPFGKSLLEFINRTWTTECVPKQWCSSAVVSILKKGGDVTVMDNYWAISIMGVLIKLLMTVVTQRLQVVCQTNQIIRRWQRGFMPGEECPLRVANIFDISGRRQALGLPTDAGFKDVRKAYDAIPHEILFPKLCANGITGHMLSFIKAL